MALCAEEKKKDIRGINMFGVSFLQHEVASPPIIPHSLLAPILTEPLYFSTFRPYPVVKRQVMEKALSTSA